MSESPRMSRGGRTEGEGEADSPLSKEAKAGLNPRMPGLRDLTSAEGSHLTLTD